METLPIAIQDHIINLSIILDHQDKFKPILLDIQNYKNTEPLLNVFTYNELDLTINMICDSITELLNNKQHHPKYINIYDDFNLHIYPNKTLVQILKNINDASILSPFDDHLNQLLNCFNFYINIYDYEL